MEKLGEKICLLRREKGLSQEELAEAIFVSRQSVSKWENGQSIPDADNIAALCSFFNVSADSLILCSGSSPSVRAEDKPVTAVGAQSKPVMRLWLKIVIITLVCFFAFLGLLAATVFAFLLIGETDAVIWTRVVPMLCVMLVIIFCIVLGVVIGLYKKGDKPRK